MITSINCSTCGPRNISSPAPAPRKMPSFTGGAEKAAGETAKKAFLPFVQEMAGRISKMAGHAKDLFVDFTKSFTNKEAPFRKLLSEGGEVLKGLWGKVKGIFKKAPEAAEKVADAVV